MIEGIARLDTRDPDFHTTLGALAASQAERELEVERVVREILADVRARGDEALLEHTARLDGLDVADARALELSPGRLARALASIDPALRRALEEAGERIEAFHERQVLESWRYEEPEGTVLGQQVTPLERVGLYVPGGRAAYPSSILMNALPARVAGVDEIVMVVPAPRGRLEDVVLATAHIAGVDRVFTIGGAQAVGALAWGTETVPRVDKIVGPGNRYVAAAKRLVFGEVGIDMIAGPSEIVVVADGTTPAAWVAADLFSQAEHDEEARSILIAPDPAYLEAVLAEMQAQLPGLSRHEIIARSLAANGALIRTRDLREAVDVANQLAPEHLELAVAEPERLLRRVRHAGAVFLGPFASEVLGDYCAGPNHVLPTARTARFSSPLGVYDFQKRTNVIGCSLRAARSLGSIAALLARAEGLTAHARAAELRMEEGGEG